MRVGQGFSKELSTRCRSFPLVFSYLCITHGHYSSFPTGQWVGVDWDDPTRGKHNGEKDGVQYFTCRSDMMCVHIVCVPV